MESSEETKMEETSSPMPWKLYHNPLYSTPSDLTLQEARAEIADLRADLEFERGLRMKMERLTETISEELEEERARREEAERANEELAGQEAELSRMRREMEEEEKKMMRVAEVFREGKEKPYSEIKMRREAYNNNGHCHRGFVSPVSVLRRSPSREPENPHIKRGIRGSVEFQRAVKAMCSLNKTSKHLRGQNGNYKLECQKAQLKILLKQRIPVRPNNSYFIS